MAAVKVSAKSDYAVRAAARAGRRPATGPVKGERLAQAQDIPLKFLENILIDLRHAGIVRSQRGAEGGYWLARAPDEVTVGEVIRAVDGPLASVRGEAPEDLDYDGRRGAPPDGLDRRAGEPAQRRGRADARRRRGRPHAGRMHSASPRRRTPGRAASAHRGPAS